VKYLFSYAPFTQTAKIFGQRSGPARNTTHTLLSFDAAECVFGDVEQIGSTPGVTTIDSAVGTRTYLKYQDLGAATGLFF